MEIHRALDIYMIWLDLVERILSWLSAIQGLNFAATLRLKSEILKLFIYSYKNHLLLQNSLVVFPWHCILAAAISEA